MADQSRRDRVGLGLIGLGSSWELIYRETLVRLQNRMTIRVVFDPVEARAKSVAGEFDADVAGSLSQILARPTLQGLLVLEPSWLGTGGLDLIARCEKPVFLAGPALRQTTTLRRMLPSPDPATACRTQNFTDDLWVPELGLRFTPSACRLRELIATKLGKVHQIRIECDLAAHIAELAHLVDWCVNLFGTPPKTIKHVNAETPAKQRFELGFPPTSHSSTQRLACLQQTEHTDGLNRFFIHCDRGDACLIDRTRIEWKTSAESAEESLVDERSETEILIDQFCRRAVGGLNPVGRLREFLRAIEIVESLRPPA